MQDKGAITAMTSMETEVVELAAGGAVRVTEQIEAWLSDLARSMRGTLAGQLDVVRTGRMQVSDDSKRAVLLEHASPATRTVASGW